MKRSITSALVAVALATGAVAAATPASARTVYLSGIICQTTEWAPPLRAVSSRGGCDAVQTRIIWRDLKGVLRYDYGSWGSSSTALARTPGFVVSRAVNVKVGSSTTGFVTY